jgi:hypothetical protein
VPSSWQEFEVRFRRASRRWLFRVTPQRGEESRQEAGTYDLSAHFTSHAPAGVGLAATPGDAAQ